MLAAAAAAEDVAEQLLGRCAVEEMLLVRRALIGIARRDRDAVDAERLDVSKKSATRAGSASLNSVQLMLTRKPVALAVLMAATARS